MLLSGCAKKTSIIPVYPKAGNETVNELQARCGEFLEHCPNIADWLTRLDLFERRIKTNK